MAPEGAITYITGDQMAKIKNYVIYDFADQEKLVRLAEEYAMLGRDVRVEHGKLTVFARPRRKHKTT